MLASDTYNTRTSSGVSKVYRCVRAGIPNFSNTPTEYPAILKEGIRKECESYLARGPYSSLVAFRSRSPSRSSSILSARCTSFQLQYVWTYVKWRLSLNDPFGELLGSRRTCAGCRAFSSMYIRCPSCEEGIASNHRYPTVNNTNLT